MFVSLRLEGLAEQTNYVLADVAPRWDEEFVFVVKQKMSCMEMSVFIVDEEGSQTTYMGEVNVPIHTLASHKSIVEWFPLQTQGAGDSTGGELQVVLYNSLQRTAMDALRELEEIYAQFLSIVSGDMPFLTNLFGLIDPTDADRVGGSVVSIFNYLGKEEGLFEYVIREEVESTASVSVLFRSNSMAIRLVSMFAKLTATSYLKALLLPLIEEILSDDPTRFEVDPARLGGGPTAIAAAKKNQKTLETMVSKCFDTIFASLNRVPRILRRIASFFVNTVERKFPGASSKAVGGFFFLRFICPAIVAPASFGLLAKHPAGKGHRALVLVAKVLQNAANGTRFKEAEMENFNEYLQQKEAKLKQFLEALGEPATGEGELLAILRPAAVADSCIIMARLFRTHLPKLLASDKHHKTAASLEVVLQDLAANERVHEKPYNVTSYEAALRRDGCAKVQTAENSSAAAAAAGGDDDDADSGVLNATRVWKKPFRPGCARELVQQAVAIFKKECETKGKTVEWAGVSKSSAEFKLFEVAVCELQKANLTLMLSEQRKQAFWLNVYHSLLLHCLFTVGPPSSSYAKKVFLSNFRYRVGPYSMSLSDIDNGVLRGNPIIKGSSTRQWLDSDRRRPLSLPPVDPSILLAMGSISAFSPVIVPYGASQLEEQLSAVVSHFLNNVVEIDSAKREIVLPKQFARIPLESNALLTWLYNYLDARKKLDVLYLQSKTYLLQILKKNGKLAGPKALTAWYEAFASVQRPEDLPEVFYSPRSPEAIRNAAATSPASPVVPRGPSGTIARRMDRSESVLDEGIMQTSMASMMQKVTGQLYDNQALAQSIYAEVCKSVSVTIAFQTGKVIREIKMQLLGVEGITWTAASLEKFKQEVPMETPKLSRLQLLQVSEQKQQQILKLLAAIQTAVVDIRFLLESVVVAMQKRPQMALMLGKISTAIKERLQWTLDRIVEKNFESAPFEELITLESAISPEIDSLISLLQLFREQIKSNSLETLADKVALLSLTAMLNWVRGQLEANSPAAPPYKAQQWDETQLNAMPQAKFREIVKTVLVVLDSVANRLKKTNVTLLEDATRAKLIEVALLVRRVRTAMTQQEI